MKEKIFLKKAEPVINFFKGMVIGISNLIPGVSGGSMALVMGIYERLVEAIGKFVTSRKKRKGYFFFYFQLYSGQLRQSFYLPGFLVFSCLQIYSPSRHTSFLSDSYWALCRSL